MGDKKQQEKDGLTADEMEQQDAAELPDREAMSLVNANLAVPVNLAAALNVHCIAVAAPARVAKGHIAISRSTHGSERYSVGSAAVVAAGDVRWPARIRVERRAGRSGRQRMDYRVEPRPGLPLIWS